ncbi:hypothetical protein F4604DRAFT_1883669 [Suillus subluteus]|nr:hypothetical protein F4604DRAFT_1883669 [Suillus subluteus]
MKALERIEIADGCNIIAATTDNPTVMQAFQWKFQEKFYWTFPCFLHGLNTIIGEICTHPFMKQHVTKATWVVTFFNGSHYWGGQLKEQAKKDGINRGLKKNCKSHWYTLVLQSMSVRDHRQSLSHLCLWEDAQKKIGGLSPVAPDIINIVLCDVEFWPAIKQGIKVMKPIVDLIRDEELIWLAKTISQLLIEDGDDTNFWQHAKAVFLALFSHPMCCKLVILQAANGRSFKFMVELAKMLVADLKEYHKCSGVFSGGQADALDWWETLPAFAIIIHSIVPHAADVERYFSVMDGVQSVKCCNLSVQIFKFLSKLQASYSNFLHKVDHEASKPTHHKHAHMHTQPERGPDIALVNELQRSFAWVPPLAGPELIMDEELLEKFSRFENEMLDSCHGLQELEGTCEVPDIFEEGVIDWNELEKVGEGITPAGFIEEIDVVGHGSQGTEAVWNISC